MLRRASSCVVGSTAAAHDAKFVELRPRFVQPMRLRFDWEDASGHPEENGGPVCGWVLPNHLEKSLTIYSASGKPLGVLQKKLGLKSGSSAPAFYWLDVPGVAPETIDNPHLRYFRDWVLGLIPDRRRHLFRLHRPCDGFYGRAHSRSRPRCRRPCRTSAGAGAGESTVRNGRPARASPRTTRRRCRRSARRCSP
jgi:hypothetical protein